MTANEAQPKPVEKAIRSVSRLILLILITCTVFFTANAQCNQPYSWVSWSTFQSSNVTGLLKVDGKTVQVNLTANFPIGSTESVFGHSQFQGFTDYKSLPNKTTPKLVWSKERKGEITICFSEAVTNPVLLLASLGGPDTTVTLTFSRPYVSLFKNQHTELLNANELKGKEGYTVILFPGTFNCLTIQSNKFEYFTNINFGVRPSTFPLTVSPPVNGCGVSSVTATGGSRHEWTGGRTPNSSGNTFDKSGTYLLKATDAQGCTTYGITTVMPPGQTEVRLGTYPPLCPDQTLTIAPSMTVATGSVSYSWASGETTPSITASKPGRYEVTVRDGGCLKTVSTTIASAPSPTLRPDTKLCLYHPTATLDAGATDLSLIYNWLTVNKQTPTIDVSQAGRYQVRVTNPSGCTATRTVDVHSPPTLSLGPAVTFCSGRQMELKPVLVGSGTYTFSWSTGDTQPTIRVSQPGFYHLTASDGICSASTSVALTANPIPIVPPDETVCFGQVVSSGSQEVGVTYLWAIGETTPDIGRQPEGVYAVTVTNGSGCSAVRTITVAGICTAQVLAPNAFTPNGDGVNDLFSPMLVNGEIAQLTVYNRWGVPVYDEVSSHPQWDGSFASAGQATGTYTYKLAYRTLGRAELLYYQGTLLLLK